MDTLIGAGGSWWGDGAEDDDLEQSGRRTKQKQCDPSGVSLKRKESSSAMEEGCFPCGMDSILEDNGGAVGLECTGDHDDGNAEVVFGVDAAIPDVAGARWDYDIDGMDEERRAADEARRERRETQWRATT